MTSERYSASPLSCNAVVAVSSLSTWYSTSTGHPSPLMWSGQDHERWVKEVSLSFPAEPRRYFWTHVSFAFGSWACWVDLSRGLLAIDILADDPQSGLVVPLPDDYDVYLASTPGGGVPDDYCTMGRVNGAIKFLAVEHYYDRDCPWEECNITTWTLQLQPHSPCRWSRDHDGLLLRDLWANDVFLASRTPICPVLSPKEPDTASFLLRDICYLDEGIAAEGEIVFSMNTRNNKVESWIKLSSPRKSLERIPRLLQTEFSAYLQWSDLDDDQGNVTHRKREAVKDTAAVEEHTASRRKL